MSNNEKLEKIAYIDELTGLRNLAGLKHNYAGKSLENIHFLYLDIDEFNKLASVFGEDAIDAILIQVGNTLINYCGNIDVYRVGVDQFLCATTSHVICEVGELSKILKQPIIHSDIQCVVNASICVLDYDDFIGETIEDVLKLLKFAIIESKRKQKNALIYADEYLKERFLEKRDIEINIHDAVRGGHFFPKFQPFVDTFNKRIVGFETVSRWRHGNKEIKPIRFLEIAEYSGLIFDIEMQMFEETAKMVRRLKDDKNIKLSSRFKASLNFSTFTLDTVDVQNLLDILDRYRLYPKEIIIEITESIITDIQAYEKIKLLHESGFFIALDEYTNSSSPLTHLIDLKVDILKLDGGLLEKIDNDQEYTKMYSAYKFFVDISKKFDLRVVSAGVKTKEHLKMVKDLEIHICSGRLFSRAVVEEEFLELFDSSRPNKW